MSTHLSGERNRSSISQSRSLSQYMSSDVDELSDEELVRKVSDIKRAIRVLTIENEILENTIMRVEPALMAGIQQALDYAMRLRSTTSINMGSCGKSTSRFIMESLTSPSRILQLSSPSRISARRVDSTAKISGTLLVGSGPKINVIERTELVGVEIELLSKNLEKARKKAAKEQALLKAQLEEIGIRVASVEKATETFNQEVIIDGWDKIAQRIPAEIWIRNMTEWVKICDSRIGKLRLRTSTLNTQYAKFKGQIRVKAELSESLRPVDFEKLEIENTVCEEVIESKKNHLVDLKKMTGDANLNLTIHKKSMIEQNLYLSNLQKNIANKKRLTIEIDKETDIITVQAANLSVKLDEVRKVRLAYEVPNILDYVQVKSDLADLKHVVKLLENRSHVQQIALKSLNKQLNSMLISNFAVK